MDCPARHWLRAATLIVATCVAAVDDRHSLAQDRPRARILPATSSVDLSLVGTYNFHFVVAEDFLNCFVSKESIQPGEVDEVILGAQVNGQLVTATRLQLDLKPSAEKAHAVFVLDGDSKTQTIGRTEQGAVQSVGTQQFHARKDVFFDGVEFSTRHATVFTQVRNQNVGASTPLDGTPLQGFANRIALRVADRQRPASEEIARKKVADRVYPMFDGEVDRQLADANQKLRDELHARLLQYRLQPSAVRATTTDKHLHLAVCLTGDEPADVQPPQANLAGPYSLSTYLHESLLNGLVERLNLRGLKTTDKQLRDLGDRLKALAPADVSQDAPAEIADLPVELTTEIHFDDDEPLKIRFADDRMLVTLRATFKPAGQSLLPPLEIQVPFRMTQTDGRWTLEAGKISIKPRPNADGEQPDPLPTIAENLIRASIAANLPRVEFPAELKIDQWPTNQPKLKLAAARAVDGWLLIALD